LDQSCPGSFGSTGELGLYEIPWPVLLTEYALLLILIGLSAIKKVGSQQP